MDERKKELIEGFSNYFEDIYHFPPLTSKIYSFLLMDCKRKGVTFDEIVELFNASKSSVSNSLTYLGQLKHVEYFTKIDSRKRFYRVSPESILMRLKRINDNLREEKKLSEKYYSYLKGEIEDEENSTLIKSDIYINHLDRAIEQLSETIEQLKK